MLFNKAKGRHDKSILVKTRRMARDERVVKMVMSAPDEEFDGRIAEPARKRELLALPLSRSGAAQPGGWSDIRPGPLWREL